MGSRQVGVPAADSIDVKEAAARALTDRDRKPAWSKQMTEGGATAAKGTHFDNRAQLIDALRRRLDETAEDTSSDSTASGERHVSASTHPWGSQISTPTRGATQSSACSHMLVGIRVTLGRHREPTNPNGQQDRLRSQRHARGLVRLPT